MFFFISKLLQEFLWPLNWILVLLVFALGALHRSRVRLAAQLVCAALTILFVFSHPFTEVLLMSSLERTFLTRRTEDFPVVDAIVVLGGSEGAKLPPRFEAEEVTASRLLPASRLFRLHKAPVVLLSSGIHYKDTEGNDRCGADDMADVLHDMGVPLDAILRETQSRNTFENAKYSLEILKQRKAKKILLVSSAFHLRRAMKLFMNPEIEVIPVPAAFESGAVGFSYQALLPSAGSMATNTKAWKEWIGGIMASLYRPN